MSENCHGQPEKARVTSVSKGPTTNRDIEGEALKAFARTIPEGQVMLWSSMMEVTKRGKKRTGDLWSKVRSDLISEGIVFKPARGEGHRRCQPEQTLEKVDNRIQTIRRTAQSALRENRTVDRKRLPAEAVSHADSQAVVLTMLESKADEVRPRSFAPSSQAGVPFAALADSIDKMK